MKSSCLHLVMMVSAFLFLAAELDYTGWLPAYYLGFEDTTENSGDPEIVIQQGHLAQISTVAFADDGRQLVSASFDGTIRIWNVQSRKLMKILRVANHVLSPPLMVASPDGKLLAAKILEEEIGIWETTSWTKISACKHRYVRFFKFTRASSTLAGTAGTKIFLCDVHGGTPEREIELERTPLSFTFNSNGSEIAVATGDEDIQRWSIQSGEELKTLSGHTGHVSAVEFSPSENLLASAGDDKTARLWNTDTGEGHILSTEARAVYQVSFSLDGNSLVTKDEDGHAKVWDVHTGRLLAALDSSERSGSAAFSPDGAYLGIVDRRSIINLNLKTLLKKELRLRAYTNVIAYDPQSKLIAFGDDADPKIWELSTGAVQTGFGRHTLRLQSIGVSADGVEVAAADSAKITVWNINTGNVRSFSPRMRIPGYALLTFSPDRSILAIHSDSTIADRTVTLWNIDKGDKVASMNDNPGPPLVFSRTGRYFADIDPDGDAKVLDLDGKAIVTIPRIKDLRALAFSPNDELLAAMTTTNRLKIWELPSGETKRTINSSFLGKVLYFASNELLVRLKSNKIMEAWNLKTGTRAAPPRVPSFIGQNHIASLRGPHEIDIFDLDDQVTVMHANLPTTGQSIAAAEWNPQKQILGTESEIGEVALWKLRKGDTAKKVCSAYVYDDGTLVVLNAEGKVDTARACLF